ncbi:MAG: tetratricopeptide repeat protein [Chlamydiia bacterium]|nr:tetratricopeptide repeat protein [Chlamydiia bacterium]
MKINPTTICGVAGATLSIGAEFLFSRIYLIVRSTLRNHGCCYPARRAISYSIAGIAGGATGLAIAAMAYRAIPHIANFMIRQANGYHAEGVHQYRSGNNESALGQFKKACTFLTLMHGKNSKHVANCHFNIGCTLLALGEHKNALETFNQVLTIYKGLPGDNRRNIADCHGFIGKLHLLQKNYDTSIEDYSKALEIYKAIKQDFLLYQLAIPHQSIGLARLQLKDSKLALEAINEALKFYKDPLAKNIILNSPSWLINLVIAIALKEQAFHQVSTNPNDSLDLEKELEPFIPLFEAEGVDTSQICLNAANALKKYGMEVDLSRLEAAINELRAPTDPA